MNPAGLLRCLWREQQQEPRCLFCYKRFRGIRAALQHMQQQRHFQLKWNEEQQDLLHRFYDYKKSYYEVKTKYSGTAGISSALLLGVETCKETRGPAPICDVYAASGAAESSQSPGAAGTQGL